MEAITLTWFIVSNIFLSVCDKYFAWFLFCINLSDFCFVLFFSSEPVLERVLPENFAQVNAQQKKTGMNSTSKSTLINRGMPRLITF